MVFFLVIQRSVDKERTFACDGSLINDQWIVSAAHCFTPEEGSRIVRVEALLGSHNLKVSTKGQVRVDIEKVSSSS